MTEAQRVAFKILEWAREAGAVREHRRPETQPRKGGLTLAERMARVRNGLKTGSARAANPRLHRDRRRNKPRRA